jgi:hypothetical protein
MYYNSISDSDFQKFCKIFAIRSKPKVLTDRKANTLVSYVIRKSERHFITPVMNPTIRRSHAIRKAHSLRN